MGRLPLAVAAAVPAGLVLGVGAQGIDHVHPGFRFVGALGVPWLVVAFGLGAAVAHFVPGGSRRGVALGAPALAGAIALLVATGAWYAVNIADGAGRYSVVIATAWAPVSAASGATFALVGAVWQRGGRYARAAGAAVVGGALLGEVVVLIGEWAGRAAHAALTLELLAALLLPVALARKAILPALALTLVAAVIFGAAEEEVRTALRAAGWRGL